VQSGQSFEQLFQDFRHIVMPGMTLWNHPGWFAYFPGNNSPPSVLAEMLTRNGVVHQTYDLFIGYPEQDAAVLDRFYDGCMRIKQELSALSPEYNPYFNVFNLSLLPGARDYHALSHLLAFDVDENPEVIGIFLSAIDTDHFTYDEIYARRVEMTNRLNDSAMVATYDGIYTGQALTASVPEVAIA
jgi:hopanoid C-3 methylase